MGAAPRKRNLRRVEGRVGVALNQSGGAQRAGRQRATGVEPAPRGVGEGGAGLINRGICLNQPRQAGPLRSDVSDGEVLVAQALVDG